MKPWSRPSSRKIALGQDFDRDALWRLANAVIAEMHRRWIEEWHRPVLRRLLVYPEVRKVRNMAGMVEAGVIERYRRPLLALRRYADSHE